MTDNEIIKFLECCSSGNLDKCKHCPLYLGDFACKEVSYGEILDLINRQKAVIERLKQERDKEHAYCNHYARMCAIANIKCAKEFAERLIYGGSNGEEQSD